MKDSHIQLGCLQLTIAPKSAPLELSNLSPCRAIQFDLPCESVFRLWCQNDLLKLKRLPRLQIFSAVSALAVTAFHMILSGKTGASCTSVTFSTHNIILPVKSSFLFLHYFVMLFPLLDCKSIILSIKWDFFSTCKWKISLIPSKTTLDRGFQINIYWHL